MPRWAAPWLAVLGVFAWACGRQPSTPDAADKAAWKQMLHETRTLPAPPRRILTLPDSIQKPTLLHVTDGRMLLLDRHSGCLHWLSSAEGRILHRFGAWGTGPGEFNPNSGVTVLPSAGGHWAISSLAKISWFDDRGQLQREIRIPPQYSPCLPWGSGYVARGWEFPESGRGGSDLATFTLLRLDGSAHLHTPLVTTSIHQGSLYNERLQRQQALLFPDHANLVFASNHLACAIATRHAGTLWIFDHQGQPELTLELPLPQRPFPAAWQERIRRRPQTSLIQKRPMEVVFYDTLPRFGQLLADADHLYLFLLPEESKQRRVIILDWRGRPQGACMLPFDTQELADNWRQIFLPPGKIHRGCLYSIEENPGATTWEITARKLL